MDKKRILIIDDEEDFCKFVKLNLELGGDFEVGIATNGKKGVKLAKRLKPDLILLDILMPGMGGFDVLRNLKKDEDTVEIPVVMLSVKRDNASKLKAAQLYDELYVTKPIGAADLTAKIEEVLKKKAY